MMKLYYVTLGSFRNMVIQSSDSASILREHLHISLGWPEVTVKEIEPGTIHDIPRYQERNAIK